MAEVPRTANGPVHAKLSLPGSQLVTEQALMIAALTDGVSEITGMRFSKTTHALIESLHQLGIVVQADPYERSCIVAGSGGKAPRKQASINCGKSKTVARLLLTFCASTPGVYHFDGEDKVQNHLWANILSLLIQQGAQVIPDGIYKMPFTLAGADALEGGDFNFDQSMPAELISALLIVAPYTKMPVKIAVSHEKTYSAINLTSAIMGEFGALVHRLYQGQYLVPVPQRYASRDYQVEPDLTIAAYFFAAAALTRGEIAIQPLKRAIAKQPQIHFLNLLEKMGCAMDETPFEFRIQGPKELAGVEVTFDEIPETFPALLTLAAFAQSPTIVTGLTSLSKVKKQRLALLIVELKKAGVEITEEDDRLTVHPSHLHDATLDTHGDYHIGMALTLLGLGQPSIRIENAKCVSKHCKSFFPLWREMLGEKSPAKS